MFPRPFILPILLIALPLAQPLSAQDAPPIDAARLLQQLDQFQEELAQKKSGSLRKAVSDLRSAIQTEDAAIEYWLDAVMATQFVGLTKENTQFREWRDKNQDKLRDGGFRFAVRMQLRWLAISLARHLTEDQKVLMPEVASFANDIASNQKALTQKFASEIINMDSGKIPVAQVLGVGYLVGGTGWETVPGKYQQIYENLVLPFWRENRSDAAIGYWDMRLTMLEASMAETNLNMTAAVTTQVLKPDLQWSRAKEFVLIGQPNRGAQEMWAILMANPGHKDAEKWTGELIAQLRQMSPAGPAPMGPMAQEEPSAPVTDAPPADTAVLPTTPQTPLPQ